MTHGRYVIIDKEAERYGIIYTWSSGYRMTETFLPNYKPKSGASLVDDLVSQFIEGYPEECEYCIANSYDESLDVSYDKYVELCQNHSRISNLNIDFKFEEGKNGLGEWCLFIKLTKDQPEVWKIDDDGNFVNFRVK